MKKLLAIISLILATLLFMLTGCSNSYSGNYQDGTSDQREEIMRTLNTLIANESTISLKTVGNSSTSWENSQYSYEKNETVIMEYSTKSEFEIKCDYSEKDNLKYYAKLEAEYIGQSGGIGYALGLGKSCIGATTNVSTEISAEIWFSEASATLYAKYSEKDMQQGITTVKENKGYVTNVDINSLKNGFGYNAQIFPSVLEIVGIVGKIDGNKIKLVNYTPNEITKYAILESETSYKAKQETRAKSESKNGTIIAYEEGKGPLINSIETVSTTEKVKMPDSKDYSAVVKFEEISEVFNRGLYLFR